MSLQPLLRASLEIQIHAFAASLALVLGLIQFLGRKGATAHRVLGWIWVGAMAVVAVSSVFVNTICTIGPFSPIHLLTLLTLVSLPAGVIAARKHQVRRHGQIMVLLFMGGLVIAGAFTFLPGRIMHDLAFGGQSEHGRCWP